MKCELSFIGCSGSNSTGFLHTHSLTVKCQVSVERIVLNLEPEVMRGPGSIPTGGNILSLDFFLFSCSKDKNGIVCEKLGSAFYLYRANKVSSYRTPCHVHA